MKGTSSNSTVAQTAYSAVAQLHTFADAYSAVTDTHTQAHSRRRPQSAYSTRQSHGRRRPQNTYSTVAQSQTPTDCILPNTRQNERSSMHPQEEVQDVSSQMGIVGVAMDLMCVSTWSQLMDALPGSPRSSTDGYDMRVEIVRQLWGNP